MDGFLSVSSRLLINPKNSEKSLNHCTRIASIVEAMIRKLWRILEAGRVGRLIMMALVTGSTAYGFGGSNRSVLTAALIGIFLALGGFYLDYLAHLLQ